MIDISNEILQSYQVRKTKAQKTRFIAFMQSKLPQLQVESGGFGKNRNLVLGNVAEAKVLLTAHYDTCAQLPFPNFITPLNILVYLIYSFCIIIPFFFVYAVVFGLLFALTHSFFLGYWLGLLAMMGAMVYVMMGGKANQHTANDNTSGVITLCELYAAMTPEERARTAIVFFDNEENGLLGSSFFRKLHKADNLKEKLIINFDCVSDGDHMLFVSNKPAKKRYGDLLEKAFPTDRGKYLYFKTTSQAFYPSDQAGFPVSIAVAALKKNKLVGLYMNKIHTKHDTVFQEDNIVFLTEGTLRLIRQI